MVTGPVGERLQAGTEDAPVLDRPASLKRVRDSGAGYKYPDFLTYLLFLGSVAAAVCRWGGKWIIIFVLRINLINCGPNIIETG